MTIVFCVDGCINVCMIVTLLKSSYRIRNHSSQIITSVGGNVEELKLLHSADGNVKVWQFLK